jgi:hypothetical protein
MHTWFRLAMWVGLITDSAHWVTTSRFGLLATRNLIHWRPTRAHTLSLAAEIERPAIQDMVV